MTTKFAKKLLSNKSFTKAFIIFVEEYSLTKDRKVSPFRNDENELEMFQGEKQNVSLHWQIECCGKIIMPRHVRLCFARKTRFFSWPH